MTPRVKEDNREPRGGWAPGKYYCRCQSCGSRFIGDKRAISCADCAYNPAVINIAVHRKSDPDFLNPDAQPKKPLVSSDEMHSEPEARIEVVWVACDHGRQIERGEHCKRCPRYKMTSHGIGQPMCFALAEEGIKYTTAAQKKFPPEGENMDIDLNAKAVAEIAAEQRAADEAIAQAQQQPIKIGDVVVLPSGGKLMTVMKIDAGRATVAWFDERDCLHQQFVDVAGLKRRKS